MSGEVTVPMLPCGELDESIAFYEALGFRRTYRQQRPNPYAVVARDDINIHLFGVEGFEPEASLGSIIVAVPDADELYEAFAAGLRDRYGKLPSRGIPRIMRPRRRSGTVRGFSVIDPGGNWLRISRLGDTEEGATKEKTTGLARVIENAARLGDAKGDHPAALRLLENGLTRFADAEPTDRVRALLYGCELHVRMGNRMMATAALQNAVAVSRTVDEPAALRDDFAHVVEVMGDLASR